MNYLIEKLKKNIQEIVDKYSGKTIDKISAGGYIISLLFSLYVIFIMIKTVFKPVLSSVISPIIYAILMALPMATFYLSMAGDYFKKPSRRLEQFVFVIIATSLIAMGYIMQISNTSFLYFLSKIKNLDTIPYSLLEGNIKMITFFAPLILVLPIAILTIKLVLDKEIRKDLIEYELDILKATVHEMDDTTIDLKICENIETGEDCKVPEKKLYEHMWIQGGSGSGKTATVIRPILDQLFYKKGYLREKQKEIAFECLKEGIAILTKPVSNEYFNVNFDMSLIEPKEGKEEEYKERFKDYIIGTRDTGEIIYKGLGVTVVAPDGGLPKDTIKISKKYGVKIHKIDPSMSEIIKGGIATFNPLKGGRPEKTGDIISSILISMEQGEGGASKSNPYFVNASVRAVRNLVIVLKIMYPIMYKKEPTLVDILHMLNNFNDIVPLVETMKKDHELKSKWGSVISYFETSFYPPDTDENGRVIPGGSRGSLRKKTEEAIGGVVNQLDNFLGRDEVKYILCPKEDNVTQLDLKQVLEKGECIAIATRQSELGQRLGRAFALFFILSLQNEVLSRFSEDENPEVPHFLIIDEFPMYVNDNTKIFFTFARKYKCSVTIAIQNMGQLKEVSDIFGETIFTNTDTKLLLPKSNVEDRKYWAEYFGVSEEFELQTGVNTSSIVNDKPSYSESIKGSMQEKQRVSEQEINDLDFKKAFYAYTDSKGKQKVGKGRTDFVNNEDHTLEINSFNFEMYNTEDLKTYEENQRIKQEQVNANLEKEKLEKDEKLLENMLKNTNSKILEEEVNEQKKAENDFIEESKITNEYKLIENEEVAASYEGIPVEEIDDMTIHEESNHENIIGEKEKIEDMSIQVTGEVDESYLGEGFNIDELQLEDEEDNRIKDTKDKNIQFYEKEEEKKSIEKGYLIGTYIESDEEKSIFEQEVEFEEIEFEGSTDK